VLAEIDQQRNFLADIKQAVQQQLPGGSTASPGEANLVATLRIEELRLVQFTREEISLRMEIELKLVKPRAPHGCGTRETGFTCHTPRESVDLWLSQGSGIFESVISVCINEIAARASEEILNFE
jgi:hypothetical protein